MALSYVPYTGDGVTANFTVTFPYLLASHVVVYVDDVSVTFSWLNGTTVTPTVIPAAASRVRIERVTPKTPLVDFTDTGVLLETDLDTANLQALYVAIEAIDRTDDALPADRDDDQWDAESARIKNVADATAAQDAVTKAQLDAVVAAAGNVPTPSDPGDDGKLLEAASGTFSWGAAITAYGKTVIAAASASAAQTVLGVSTFVKTLLSSASAGAFLTTLGVSSFAQTVLDDTTAAAARTTLGITGGVAWAYINGTGTAAILASAGVSGMVDDGTGTYTVQWDPDFTSVNYAVLVSPKIGAVDLYAQVNVLAAGSASVIIRRDDTSANVDASFSISASGVLV